MKELLSHWSTANVLTRGCHKYFPARVLHRERGETVELLFLCLHKEGFVSQSEEERGQQCEKWRKEWSLCVLKIVNKCKHVCLENEGLCMIQREFILKKGRVSPQLFCSREYFFLNYWQFIQSGALLNIILLAWEATWQQETNAGEFTVFKTKRSLREKKEKDWFGKKSLAASAWNQPPPAIFWVQA